MREIVRASPKRFNRIWPLTGGDFSPQCAQPAKQTRNAEQGMRNARTQKRIFNIQHSAERSAGTRNVQVEVRLGRRIEGLHQETTIHDPRLTIHDPLFTIHFSL